MCRISGESSFGRAARAKLIVKANPLPSAFPSMLEGYNGKPVLITASGHVFAGGAPLALGI